MTELLVDPGNCSRFNPSDPGESGFASSFDDEPLNCLEGTDMVN